MPSNPPPDIGTWVILRRQVSNCKRYRARSKAKEYQEVLERSTMTPAAEEEEEEEALPQLPVPPFAPYVSLTSGYASSSKDAESWMPDELGGLGPVRREMTKGYVESRKGGSKRLKRSLSLRERSKEMWQAAWKAEGKKEPREAELVEGWKGKKEQREAELAGERKGKQVERWGG